MHKDKVAAFFNNLAPDWDRCCHHDSKKINKILDYAQIEEGSSVLDVACGTGVLFPFYLERAVKGITGIDLSPAMIEKAREKFPDPRIKLYVGDAEEARLDTYDRCVIYSAFPHFENPGRLIHTLSNNLGSGGRLTIAHSESREKIDHRHKNGASEVSLGLKPAKELALMLSPLFDVDIVIDDDEMYVVSGVKR